MDLKDKRLGLTPYRIEVLNTLGINTAEEALSYYPFRYDILNKAEPSLWKEKDKVTFEGTVSGRVTALYVHGKNMAKFDVLADEEIIHITIFNRPWAKQLKDGDLITVTGIYNGKNRVTAMTYNKRSLDEQAEITPVYSVKAGIRQKTVRACMERILFAMHENIPDVIPIRYRRKYRLSDKETALKRIHFPNDREEIHQAYRTLKYEDFLKFFTSIELMKSMHGASAYKEPRMFDQRTVDQLIASLPFPLTSGQKKAVGEILNDMSSPSPMYRLLQGDVGCGKTAVAGIAMAACALAGYQAAILAPTEILARQHADSLRSLLSSLSLKIEVLYSGQSSSDKEQVLKGLQDGTIDIIAGTHSLIQEGVEFHRLGLVVADEQQRFGVAQRKALREKGYMVDFLLMSATPIPRTLASTLYGDMEISTIETLPEGRKPVYTKLIRENSFRSVLNDVKALLDQGHQLYVITAAIEKNENYDARAALDVALVLSSLFAPYRTGVLHGRMSSSEKETVMREFYDNDIQVLVSTTVVEVGMNVVNATGMIIYDADRFGLSQLHQLRGRVQRGKDQGYCWLLTSSREPSTLERLEVLEKTTDGFVISMEDLRLRGPGDILGTRQSGLPEFLLGNMIEDTGIMNAARQDAYEIMMDPDHPDCARLLDLVREGSRNNAGYAD